YGVGCLTDAEIARQRVLRDRSRPPQRLPPSEAVASWQSRRHRNYVERRPRRNRCRTRLCSELAPGPVWTQGASIYRESVPVASLERRRRRQAEPRRRRRGYAELFDVE